MSRFGRRASSQTRQQIISHLMSVLREERLYTLTTDPLNIHITIRECERQKRTLSEKQMNVRREFASKSKKIRRLSATRRRTGPKIRSVKKGRTVNLKGAVY
jgi:hypothetical protein